MLLQLEDEEEIQSDSTAGGVEEEKTGLYNHHLSLNTMKGFNGVGTIRFTGEIGSIRVKILILPKEVLKDILRNLAAGVDPNITMLLQIYDKVFKVPSELPPKREKDHSIPLHPGTWPVKVRYFQKEVLKDILSNLAAGVDPNITMLLQKYDKVFKVPSALPPKREKNHVIPLHLGTWLVKVRSYRYPHTQKEQIEKMVQEMLE
ncbi:hypothetical protein KIW84_013684 [Lathyrus oleraceus]|uniref:Uncharacterized protein n=1 Tax=Pisum sativum TaxID=3888 RepID=A0A9D5BKR9_PEA|nr:hypothetical protein KIW84_013684 [Pisum sativum]